MITKFVLIVWLGAGTSQILSTQSFNTQEECLAVALVLEHEMGSSLSNWYRCVPYTFDSTE
jgi:hypothetical protein